MWWQDSCYVHRDVFTGESGMMERLFEFNAYTDNFSQEVLNLIKSDYNYWEETPLMEFNINHKYLHYGRQHNEFWTSDYFNTREKKFLVKEIFEHG